MPPILTQPPISNLLFPVYVVQGIYVRTSGDAPFACIWPPVRSVWGGRSRRCKLLTIGDSSAAAVGSRAHKRCDCVRNWLYKLHQKERRDRCSWHISGHNSAVAGEIRDVVVPNLADPIPYTHILIMLGTNDMKNWHSVARWKKEFGNLLYALRTPFPRSQDLLASGH